MGCQIEWKTGNEPDDFGQAAVFPDGPGRAAGEPGHRGAAPTVHATYSLKGES